MTESYILYSLEENKIIKQYNANYWFRAASLVKLVYAIELMRKIERGELKNEKVKIIDKYLLDEGTNILRDLTLDNTSSLMLPLKTLIRLMLKHSCNGSTYAIWDHLVPTDKFRNRLSSIWKLDTRIFDNSGNFKNTMRPTDILTTYQHIYGNNSDILTKETKKFLQNCLEEGKSRYSIFDQKSFNIKILGCKGGQLFEPAPINKAYYHGSGVFQVKNSDKKYIIVVMTESSNLAIAREKTRKIGKKLLSIAEKS